ncbi:hypothetical protein BDK51DRAFT_39305 [Blyttiomyces helicus]|uniref:Uncharacterized protein n=1 Tax=Blyttiomyces helicus TaxID=388810 RepID=A0A4P9W732_9FUNG|nr:hypothetical protein BDK51DRAFT_39305 [Blyttiomyces helicus]|eukprot:RKO88261.1 hypothetical protein BDK51DRAFT_39305 [Blyttiomyces helicus]
MIRPVEPAITRGDPHQTAYSSVLSPHIPKHTPPLRRSISAFVQPSPATPDWSPPQSATARDSSSTTTTTTTTTTRTPTAFPVELLPLVLAQLPHASQALPSLTVSRRFFLHAAARIYTRLVFTQTSGQRLQRVLATFEASAAALDGEASGATAFAYAGLVREVVVSQIEVRESDATARQSWRDVRDLLCAVAPGLERLALATGDDAFLNVAGGWIPAHVTFPNLERFAISPRCVKFSEELVVDLLRRSGRGKLRSVRMKNCMRRFGGAGWYLIAEKGGGALEELVISPAGGGDPGAGWDPVVFASGLAEVVRSCLSLRVLDVSGSRGGIDDKQLGVLLTVLRDLEVVRLPCGINDAHLLAVLTAAPPSLVEIDVACGCGSSGGPGKAPCNTFSDAIARKLVEELYSARAESLMADIVAGRIRSTIVLPSFLRDVKTAKWISSLQWAETLPSARVDFADSDAVVYQGVRIRVPGGRDMIE